jgi:hypothetical protein
MAVTSAVGKFKGVIVDTYITTTAAAAAATIVTVLYIMYL